jgi:hypothetical protein
MEKIAKAILNGMPLIAWGTVMIADLLVGVDMDAWVASIAYSLAILVLLRGD